MRTVNTSLEADLETSTKNYRQSVLELLWLALTDGGLGEHPRVNNGGSR